MLDALSSQTDVKLPKWLPHQDPPAGADVDFSSERTEVPVQHHEAGLIKTCGEGLAKLVGAYCIGYQGESYRLYHRLLA